MNIFLPNFPGNGVLISYSYSNKQAKPKALFLNRSAAVLNHCQSYTDCLQIASSGYDGRGSWETRRCKNSGVAFTAPLHALHSKVGP